jgi:chromosome partitioning protein
MSARVILIAVPKGGSGKTTTAQTLGLAFVEAGKRVLFVDTDPQGNLSSVLGYWHKRGAPTLYTVLREFTFNRKKTLPRAIYRLSKGVDLVPATMALNAANDELAAQVEREHILEKLLAPVKEDYDVIVFDSLPYLGVLVNNALVAADELIIPVQAEPLGIAGTAMMLTHLQKVRDDGMIAHLVIRGGLITMVDRRTAINTQSIDYAHQMLGSHMPFFATEIERTVRVAEAQLMKQSVLTYRPRETEKVAQAYRAVRDELLEGRIGVSVQSLNVPPAFVEEILELTEEEETGA